MYTYINIVHAHVYEFLIEIEKYKISHVVDCRKWAMTKKDTTLLAMEANLIWYISNPVQFHTTGNNRKSVNYTRSII